MSVPVAKAVAVPVELSLSDSVTRQRAALTEQRSGEPAKHVPVRAVPRRSVLDLMAAATHSLDEARTSAVNERYVHAHVAALRAGAAVVAARAVASAPSGASRRRRGVQSLWDLLRDVAPELGEWAAYFAASAAKRAAAEAGILHAVSEREADDLMRDSQQFVGLVETALGLPAQRRIV